MRYLKTYEERVTNEKYLIISCDKLEFYRLQEMFLNNKIYWLDGHGNLDQQPKSFKNYIKGIIYQLDSNSIIYTGIEAPMLPLKIGYGKYIFCKSEDIKNINDLNIKIEANKLGLL